MDFSKKVKINDDILQKEVEDNLVFCNLDNENFYKLDPFSRKIFETVLNSGSINESFRKLVDQYDVESDILKQDLENLVLNLLNEKIIKLS